MRGLLSLALAAAPAVGAGCYAPGSAAGTACTTVCPGDLVCVDGTCMDSGDVEDASLVAHWKFDDDPDDADGALDSSGRGHHAACEECPELVPGRIGGGYRFDAFFEELLVVPDHADFRGEYTISAWVLAGSTTDQIAILSKPFGNGTGNSWQLEILEDDRVSLSGGDPHGLSSPDPIPPGQWRHIAGRWDGTEKELFIDGEEVIEVDATVEYDGHAIYLGGDQNNGNEVLHWEGVLDDLRVYNRALSSSEIEDLAR